MPARHPTQTCSGPRRLSRRQRLAIAILVAAAVVLTLARPAQAGNYVVSQCSSVTPSSQGSWERSSDHYRARALCGTDAGLQAFHDADATGLWQFGAWVWRAPAGTVFTDVQANASLTYQAGHRGELVVTRPSGELVGFGAEHNDFRVHSIPGEFTQFHSWLRCVAPGAGQPCGRAAGDTAHAYVRGVFLRTEDRSAPRLTLTGGSLLEPEVIRGVRGLTFAAADVGSGIRKVDVEGNGVVMATDVRNCAVAAGFATALTPCPTTTTESAGGAAPAAGRVTGPANRVSGCVEDRARDGDTNPGRGPASVDEFGPDPQASAILGSVPVMESADSPSLVSVSHSPPLTRLSASRRSFIDSKRAVGSFSRQRVMSATIAGEISMPGCTSCMGGGGSFTCAMSVATLLPRSKGTLPETISKRMIPSE